MPVVRSWYAEDGFEDMVIYSSSSGPTKFLLLDVAFLSWRWVFRFQQERRSVVLVVLASRS